MQINTLHEPLTGHSWFQEGLRWGGGSFYYLLGSCDVRSQQALVPQDSIFHFALVQDLTLCFCSKTKQFNLMYLKDTIPQTSLGIPK